MKYLFTSAKALLLIPFTLWVTSLIAQTNITTTIGSYNSSTCAVGDTIVVPVTIAMGSIPTAAISLTMDYDSTKLRCISAVTSLNPAISAEFLSICGLFQNLNANPPYTSSTRRQFRAAWFNLNPVTINGLLFNVRFVVTALGNTAIKWDTATPGNCEYTDEVADVIPNCSFVDGSITCGSTAPVCGITLSSASGTNIQSICLGSAITQLTYFTTGGTGATVTGLPPGVAGVLASNAVAISGTPTAAGTFNYTVTLSGCTGGTSTATGTITVTAPPPAGSLSGTQSICVAGTTTFVSTVSGGSWSSSATGVATVNASTGVVTGVAAGTATITYTVPGTGGCANATATRTVTVNPSNTITLSSGSGTNTQTVTAGTAITPITYTTTGATGATISGLPAGVTGIWASNVVTISGTPSATGTFNYTVTMTGGCIGGNNTASGSITVNPASPNISTTIGSVSGCVGDTVTVPVTISMASGISTAAISMAIDYDSTKLRCISAVTGLNANIATGFLSNCGLYTSLNPNAPYNASTRRQFRAAWFNLAPVAFNGLMFNVRFVILASGSSPVIWDLSTPGNCEYADEVADVIPNTEWINGRVTGMSPVTAGTISGTPSICIAGSTTFTSTQTGGSWSSSAVGVATVNSTTGVVTGIAAGTATIAYTVTGTGGCANAVATRTVTVTAPVSAGILSGTQAICVGGNTNFASIPALVNSNIVTSIGSYYSNNAQIGDTIVIPIMVNMTSGITTAAISLAMDYDSTKLRCISAVTSLNPAISVGFLSNCGLFLNLNANPPYTSSTRRQFRAAWFNLTPVTINGLLFNVRFVVTAPGNTEIKWDTATPGNCEYADDVADVIPNTNFVNGLASIGMGVAGSWSSSAPSIASVDLNGKVTGIAAGTATIAYTVTGTGGCANAVATRTVTVTAPVSAGILNGTQSICVAGTTTFVSTVSGGSWSSSAVGVATVNSTTGVVTGVAAGTATITYTVTGTGGCANAVATRTVTVTAPVTAGTLNGTQSICVAGTTTFVSTVSGGSWSSSAVGVATVNSTTGVVTGVAAGTATITYTVTGTGGCANAVATRTVTVTAPVTAGALSGTQEICINGSTTFTSTQTGGSWSSSAVGVATVNSTTGVVTGIAAGTATIAYTVTGTGGCANAVATRTVTVTAPVSAGILSGTQAICVGGNTNFASIPALVNSNIVTSIGSYYSNNAQIGDTIVIPIMVNMTSGITTAAISLAMDYDSTKLRCISAVTSLNPAISVGFLSNCGLFLNLNANPPYTSSTRRQFRAAWFNLTPVTINGLLFNVRFVVTAPGNTEIKWDTATPGNCEYADDVADVIPNTNFVNGLASIGMGVAGSWSSSAPSIASVDLNGKVTGIVAGTATIAYTVTGTGGCANAVATRTVTVTAPVSAGILNGTQSICVAGTTTFVSTVSGGSWSSSAVGVATVNSTTGVVTGVAAGTATITYTVTGTGGCANAVATRTVTVTAPVTAGTLNGTQSICVAGTTTFVSTVSGGSWSSSAVGVATVNSTTGVVTGVAAGTATITYTVTGTGGCANAVATRTVTVTAPVTAGALSGTQEICINGSTTFTSTQTGGSWSSSAVGVATVNSTTGVVTGIAAGTATIAYTVTGTGGCANAVATRTVTVTAPVSAGILSGTQAICVGGNTNFASIPALVNSNIVTSIGSYYSNNAQIGDTIVIPIMVNMTSGITTAAISLAMDYDSTKLRCISAVTSLNPAISVGFLSNCGLFSNLNANPPYTSGTRRQFRAAWFNLTPVTINGLLFNVRFVVTAPGNTEIKWDTATPGSCEYADDVADVIPNTNFVNGLASIGMGVAGSWSSSAPSIASVDLNGKVTGIAAGTATIAYTVTGTGGCANAVATRTVTVTAPVSAGALSGTQEICINGSTTFTSTQTGGSWSSSAVGVATVNSTTGVVTGIAAGTATIAYTVTGTGGCANAVATRTVTVTAPVSAGALSGTQEICINGSTTFTSTQTGGSWSSSAVGVATVNSTTGVVTGVAAGTATITYTVTGTGGCANAVATRTVTVTAPPNAGTLIGTQEICVGGNTNFTSIPALGNSDIVISIGSHHSNNTSIGDTIALPIMVNMASGISTAAISLAIDFDSTKLRCISTVSGLNPLISNGFLSNSFIIPNLSPNFPYYLNSRFQFRAAWFNLVPVSFNGLMFNLHFVVKDTGYSLVKWDLATAGICEFADELANVIPNTSFLDGIVSIGRNVTSSWSSSSPLVATVDRDGKVSGISAGTTLITYSVPGTGGCSNATANRAVTVTAPPNTGTLVGTQEICVGGNTNFNSIPDLGNANIVTSIGSYYSNNAQIGDTIVLPIMVNMASGISTGAISMAIDYDTAKLRCISAVSGLNPNISAGYLSNCGFFSNLTPNLPYAANSRNQFRAAWFNLVPVLFNGLMFNLHFVVVAGGSSLVKWDLATAGNCEYVDELADVIPNTNFVDGVVSIGMGVSSAWSTDAVSTATVDHNGKVTGVAAGTATISYTVIGTGGCSATTVSRHVTVIPQPNSTVLVNGSLNFCVGDSLSLTAATSTGLTYEWLKNGIDILGANQINFIVRETGTYTLKVTNSFGCSSVSDPIICFTRNCNEVSGFVRYSNNSTTPLSNTRVFLSTNSGIPPTHIVINIDSTQTNSLGRYSFNNYLNQSYILQARPNKPWGGVSATDALAINRHITGQVPLNGINLLAADVNGSNSVNNTDALLVLRRYNFLVTGFSVGDFVSEKINFQAAGFPISDKNIRVLCYGDVNGSYSIGNWARLGSKVYVESESRLEVRGLSFSWPIFASSNDQLGSISLAMGIPQGLEVVSVQSYLPNGHMEFGQNADELRIGWFSQEGVQTSVGQHLFDLVLRISDEQRSEWTPQEWEMRGLSELADYWATPYEFGRLSMPSISRIRESLVTSKDLLAIPNPSSGDTKLQWTLSAPVEHAYVRVVDALGRVVMEENLGTLEEGSHTLDLPSAGWALGSYGAQLLYTSQDGRSNRLGTILKRIR